MRASCFCINEWTQNPFPLKLDWTQKLTLNPIYRKKKSGKYMRSKIGRRSNQSILKGISPEYLLEGLMLKLVANTLATSCEELTHLKIPWCWEWLKAGGEGDDRGWDGRMASPTQCTWVWVNSGSWWWTGRPGMQSMGSQRVGHDWATELNQRRQKNCAQKIIRH